MKKAIIVLVSIALWPLAAGEAAEPSAGEGWSSQLAACLDVEAEAERLTCLEAVARALVELSEVAGPILHGGQSPAPTSDTFPAEPAPFHAIVLDVRRRPRGEWVLALDNGQTWTELQRGRSTFRPGMAVRIEPAFTGSHLLTTENGAVVRVRRIFSDG